MYLSDVSLIFNRSLTKSFDLKKLLLVFVILLLCGLLVVFFRGLAVGAGSWVKKSMMFLPIFLCSGVMLSAGIILIRIYHDEVKERSFSYREMIGKSWEIVIGASYFSIPIILCYLLLWMLMGIFLFLEQVPYVGSFFSVILAFAPFLLNLGSIILCLLNIVLLFFVTPALALKGLNGMRLSKGLVKRVESDVFGNLLLAVIAVAPLFVVLGILMLAGFMSGTACVGCTNPLFVVLRWFFIMIPFVAALAPTVIFFFNFAAESHVLFVKFLKEKET